MRRLVRPNPAPFPRLRDQTETLVEDYDGSEPYKPSWQDQRWRHPRVLGALFSFQGRSCAYCQGALTPSDRGDVDHFRPKSRYWWLGYTFDNYLLSCARCNRIRKGSRFPLAPGEPGLRFGDGRAITDERKLLLDPCRDPLDSLVLSLRRGFWYLKARNPEDPTQSQVKETIRFFELNLGGHPGARQRVISQAIEEAHQVREGTGSPSRVQKLACRYRPYGDFVRRVLDRAGFTDLLPSPREEVGWLLSDLRLDLESFDSTLAEHPDHRDTQQLREAVLWSLAFLWWAPPPVVAPHEIGAWIGDRYRSEVRRRRDRLEADQRSSS